MNTKPGSAKKEYAAARRGITLTAANATNLSATVQLSSDLLPQNSKQIAVPLLSSSLCDYSFIRTSTTAASSTATVSATLSTSPSSAQAAQQPSSDHSSTQGGMQRQKSALFQSGSILRSTDTVRLLSSPLPPVRTLSERFLSTSCRFRLFVLFFSFSLLKQPHVGLFAALRTAANANVVWPQNNIFRGRREAAC
ncbi:uncharacterized protein MONOS_14666 [Monocercomonoides exilis]|uniref:uncharacterized protein n=1 Tax=Monocercomonoides exilis TaxID=2049356 RepID=UPI00355A8623|nr:hypothetical protein MONOS_14666 [Monocercomonoides exilis]|eukprot:MONOS_14666.1-p1 / transcript=MONOS_14666.1 / gene=MONOS_14666 / organism=Monocercomonoides_exilis_PA203 / gene_product=unspecified product / transcript_product=unspecified product / location=Mono_scaffold01045:5213-5797(+) / protein_length=195 / sequence_SO=supercontig / SO=protein_coding / is_pseudo=false